MSHGRPVARLVAPVIARVGLMTALMAMIAVAGVVLSTTAVNYLTDELQPAAAANQDVFQDLTDMSAAVEAWTSTGLPSAADDYRQAMLRLPAHEEEVRRFSAGDRGLAATVEAQEQAAQTWIDRYAEPVLATDGGRDDVPARQVRMGNTQFDAIRTTHQATSQTFDSRVRQASSDADVRLRGTIVAVLLLAIAAWFVVARSRRKLMADLSEPLLALEKVVLRMARNDHDVRAPLTGPKEVQAVATALNDFADAQARSRSVEAWIQRELRTLDTAKDDFVANVSHELRTPLTTVSGYLELVADEFDGRMEPRHERMLEASRRNVGRLKLLIDDLLTLSQAEGRTSPMDTIDLVAVVREVVMDVKINAARRGIHLGLAAPDRSVLVLGDRAMLHRAFLTVVSNAVKFSHDDDRIQVVVRTAGEHEVEVEIADSGIGIPAAEIDRLGTRFFRASNAVTNEIAGTGLGVRIMQTIVDKHAGGVVIESDEGTGTTVIVRLPMYVAVPEVGAPTIVLPVPAAEPVDVLDTDGDLAAEADPEDELPKIIPAFPRRKPTPV